MSISDEQPSAARQEWHCEACDTRGVVEYQPHADVYTVVYAIADDHRDRSPNCTASVRTIRIIND